MASFVCLEMYVTSACTNMLNIQTMCSRTFGGKTTRVYWWAGVVGLVLVLDHVSHRRCCLCNEVMSTDEVPPLPQPFKTSSSLYKWCIRRQNPPWSSCYHLGQCVVIRYEMLSSGAIVIIFIWDKILSSGIKCYPLELMLWSGTKWYHLGCNVIIWSSCYHLELMLSSVIKYYHLELMLSSGTKCYNPWWNVIIWS